MSESPNPAANALRLGPFHVSTARAEVEAFRRETGWPATRDDVCEQTRVPHTFPIRWLSLANIHAAIESALTAAGGIAFHESQSFAYEGQLGLDQVYEMTAEVSVQANPNRLILQVAVARPPHQPLLQMETVLRIVTTESVR